MRSFKKFIKQNEVTESLHCYWKNNVKEKTLNTHTYIDINDCMILSLNKVISVRSKETVLKEGSNSDIGHQSAEHLFPVHNCHQT